MKKILLGTISLALTLIVSAQDSAVVAKTEPAVGMRAEGKIYVVLAVSVTILCGLFIYLIRLDRKISRFEKSALPK